MVSYNETNYIFVYIITFGFFFKCLGLFVVFFVSFCFVLYLVCKIVAKYHYNIFLFKYMLIMNIYNVYEWVRMCVQCNCVTVRIICFTNNEIFTLNT